LDAPSAFLLVPGQAERAGSRAEAGHVRGTPQIMLWQDSSD